MDKENKDMKKKLDDVNKKLEYVLIAPKSPVDMGNGFDGYVYFINIRNTAQFKIGYTTQDPNKRLSNLQTANPMELVLYKTVPCNDPIRLEKHLHACFAEHRLRGEWFDLESKDVDNIVEFLNGNNSTA
jgi:hypothetical protein